MPKCPTQVAVNPACCHQSEFIPALPPCDSKGGMHNAWHGGRVAGGPSDGRAGLCGKAFRACRDIYHGDRGIAVPSPTRVAVPVRPGNLLACTFALQAGSLNMQHSCCCRLHPALRRYCRYHPMHACRAVPLGPAASQPDPAPCLGSGDKTPQRQDIDHLLQNAEEAWHFVAATDYLRLTQAAGYI